MKSILILLSAVTALASAFSIHYCNDCNKEYNPACGFNGNIFKMFDNECLMLNAHCYAMEKNRYSKVDITMCGSMIDDSVPIGAPPQPGKPNCSKTCTMESEPLCGTDGNTFKLFGSKCQMDLEFCANSITFHPVNMHFCEIVLAQINIPETSPPEIPQPPKGNPSMINDSVIIVAPLQPEKPICSKICTMETDPLCGTDGKAFKLFGNKCQMDLEFCATSVTFHPVSMHFCKKVLPQVNVPETPPSEIPQPPKGKPSVIDNSVIIGAPILPGKPSCSKFCTMENDPVCGANGKTFKIFGNKCQMDLESCENSFVFLPVNMDLCEKILSQVNVPDTFPSKLPQPSHGKPSNYRPEVNLGSKQIPKECSEACTLNYSPICGKNGQKYKVFMNTCEMNKSICSNTPFEKTSMNFCKIYDSAYDTIIKESLMI